MPCLKPPFSKDTIDFLKKIYRKRSYYGGPIYVCGKCSALFWYHERCKDSAASRYDLPVCNVCCHSGKVSLPIFPDWPYPLNELMCFNGDATSEEFMRMIRQYNSMFCFTSLGADIDNSINTGNAPYVFKMCGVVYHRIGSLLPPPDGAPKYAQLYIVDSADELVRRMDVFGQESAELSRQNQYHRPSEPDPFIVQSLTEMLDLHNPYTKMYRMARIRLHDQDVPNMRIQFYGDEGGSHGNRYSGPTASEVAALIVGDLTPKCHKFDVVVEAVSGDLEHISHLNPSLMPLQYPLLFPYGDKGFHVGIPYEDARPARHQAYRQSASAPSKRKKVSMLEYYSYYFYYRANEPNPYTCCGRLSHQAAVNAYSCVEVDRLSYHFLHQKELRSETYQGITDAMGEGNTTGKNIGVQYMLHSSFTEALAIWHRTIMMEWQFVVNMGLQIFLLHSHVILNGKKLLMLLHVSLDKLAVIGLILLHVSSI